MYRHSLHQLVFGESKEHIVPKGKTLTAEEVRARQPDTEEYLTQMMLMMLSSRLTQPHKPVLPAAKAALKVDVTA